jgi:hypothetical protein
MPLRRHGPPGGRTAGGNLCQLVGRREHESDEVAAVVEALLEERRTRRHMPPGSALAGVRCLTIYGVAAAVAAAMGLWSFVVAGRRPSPATLHPQPG